MGTLVFILTIIGLVSLIFELLAPGFGIFGIIGIILMILSWGITIFTINFGFIIVLLEIFLITIFLAFIIKKLKNTQIYSKFILSDVLLKDKKDIGNMEQFVGKEGICKTDLRPFGNAEFNGIVLEVLSDEGYIKSNSLIKITKFENNKLYVKLVNTN
ncbi:NfeD family protein [[Clostridium] colinum]|uniref:NfeD family protein n=1 Tax=[Clostridium] colinum TaxID=36835 RepID=UPI002025433D|nr:NfeD family protein [[Clostridium] colinum]